MPMVLRLCLIFLQNLNTKGFLCTFQEWVKGKNVLRLTPPPSKIYTHGITSDCSLEAIQVSEFQVSLFGSELSGTKECTFFERTQERFTTGLAKCGLRVVY